MVGLDSGHRRWCAAVPAPGHPTTQTRERRGGGAGVCVAEALLGICSPCTCSASFVRMLPDEPRRRRARRGEGLCFVTFPASMSVGCTGLPFARGRVDVSARLALMTSLSPFFDFSLGLSVRACACVPLKTLAPPPSRSSCMPRILRACPLYSTAPPSPPLCRCAAVHEPRAASRTCVSLRGAAGPGPVRSPSGRPMTGRMESSVCDDISGTAVARDDADRESTSGRSISCCCQTCYGSVAAAAGVSGATVLLLLLLLLLLVAFLMQRCCCKRCCCCKYCCCCCCCCCWWRFSCSAAAAAAAAAFAAVATADGAAARRHAAALHDVTGRLQRLPCVRLSGCRVQSTSDADSCADRRKGKGPGDGKGPSSLFCGGTRVSPCLQQQTGRRPGRPRRAAARSGRRCTGDFGVDSRVPFFHVPARGVCPARSVRLADQLLV